MSNKDRFRLNKAAIDKALAEGEYRRDIAKRFGINDEYLLYNYIMENWGDTHPSMTRKKPSTLAKRVDITKEVYAIEGVALPAAVCRNLFKLGLSPRRVATAYGFDVRDFCAWTIRVKIVKALRLPNERKVRTTMEGDDDVGSI